MENNLTPLEYILMNAYKDGMISFMETHPEAFEEAITLAISNKQPFAWRSAWLLWSCIKENDPRIMPYIKDIINALHGKQDGHSRELLKILLIMDIDEAFEGILFDHCIGIWEKINKQPSVRLNAFKMALKIAKKHPELWNELPWLIQSHYVETLSPGIKNCIERLMGDLKQDSL